MPFLTPPPSHASSPENTPCPPPPPHTGHWPPPLKPSRCCCAIASALCRIVDDRGACKSAECQAWSSAPVGPMSSTPPPFTTYLPTFLFLVRWMQGKSQNPTFLRWLDSEYLSHDSAASWFWTIHDNCSDYSFDYLSELNKREQVCCLFIAELSVLYSFRHLHQFF